MSLEKYKTAIDKIYNHSKECREAVIKHFGLWHPVQENESKTELDIICKCGHSQIQHFNGCCDVNACNCSYFKGSNGYVFSSANRLKPSQPEQNLPQTVREDLPNDQNLAGTFVIFCFKDGIHIKARGLTPRQLVNLFGKIILLLFK